MRPTIIASTTAVILALGGLALAQAPAQPAAPAPGATPKTVYELAVTGTPAKLTVTSASIKEAQPIADTYSQNGANKSPQLSWTPGPATTKSYLIVVQDPIPGRPAPVQHWIIYDIPSTVMSLPEGLPVNAMVMEPKGAMQATAGNVAGYRGPRPPAGETHNYVFQVFALDVPNLPGGGGGPGGSMAQMASVNAAMVAEAIKGHVVAAGTLAAPYTAK